MEEQWAWVAAKGPDREEVHRPGENSSPEPPSLYPEPPDQSSEARLSDIMIKTQSMTIRDSHQKEIQEDLDHGKIMEEPFGDKAVIDPTEGAFDLSNSVRTKESFDGHRPHLLVSMVPFSFIQRFLPNEFCISRQGKVEKKKVISRG
jgi:hypothetical protein